MAPVIARLNESHARLSLKVDCESRVVVPYVCQHFRCLLAADGRALQQRGGAGKTNPKLGPQPHARRQVHAGQPDVPHVQVKVYKNNG